MADSDTAAATIDYPDADDIRHDARYTVLNLTMAANKEMRLPKFLASLLFHGVSLQPGRKERKKRENIEHTSLCLSIAPIQHSR